VPGVKDWKSEHKASYVEQLGKVHPSDPGIRKLDVKRRQYFEVSESAA
jgi:hypothetical protein